MNCHGYGKKQGKCTKEGGGKLSPFYCKECDDARVKAYIETHGKFMKEILHGKTDKDHKRGADGS